MIFPLPSNLALKCVAAVTADAGPMGSQPKPPAFQASFASPAPLTCVAPLPSVSKSRSFRSS